MDQIRLTKTLDAAECARRNAVSVTAAHLSLPAGSIGKVVERLGEGYLVEFGDRGPDRCDWLGVLYASEIEMTAEVVAQAA